MPPEVPDGSLRRCRRRRRHFREQDQHAVGRFERRKPAPHRSRGRPEVLGVEVDSRIRIERIQMEMVKGGRCEHLNSSSCESRLILKRAHWVVLDSSPEHALVSRAVGIGNGPQPAEEVLAYYGRGLEDERLDHDRGKLERWRTQELLLRYLPAPPAIVLDVGGATGHYALWLAEQGYEVHLVEPVPLHVDTAGLAPERYRAGGCDFALCLGSRWPGQPFLRRPALRTNCLAGPGERSAPQHRTRLFHDRVLAPPNRVGARARRRRFRRHAGPGNRRTRLAAAGLRAPEG